MGNARDRCMSSSAQASSVEPSRGAFVCGLCAVNLGERRLDLLRAREDFLWFRTDRLRAA
jgi:hypothetical protein